MAGAAKREQVRVKSAMRYPGSKEKIADQVNRWFVRMERLLLTEPPSCFCEPFIGGGAMLVRALPSLPTNSAIIIADRDPGVASLWRVVRSDRHRDRDREAAGHQRRGRRHREPQEPPAGRGEAPDEVRDYLQRVAGDGRRRRRAAEPADPAAAD